MAEREFDRNKVRIEAGEMFRAQSLRTGGSAPCRPVPAPLADPAGRGGVVSATDKPCGQGVVKG